MRVSPCTTGRRAKTASLTEDFDRTVSGAIWAPDSSGLYAAVDDAAHYRIHRIDVPSGKTVAITREHSFTDLRLSADGSVLVALRQSFSEPPTLVRVDPASGGVTKLSTFNDSLLAEVTLGRYESVTYPGANEVPIQMWVVYPPGFDPARRYPLYLLLHGGPHNGMPDGWHFRWNAQVFAGWGYVTAWHNFHGSSGFGQAFTDSINPHLNTPTLVIHGQLDYRVPLNHGLELFNILQNRGVRSRFVYYPDENHWILKPHNSLHWYRTKQQWLDEFRQ